MATTTILTGKTLTKSSTHTPPDMGILGFGGDYYITLGLYNATVLGGGVVPTEGLLANTLLSGKVLTKPE